jgi:acetolactate synthase-1/2/3 large subunit
VAGNWAVCESDLLLCAGARFDDRITGKVDKYAQEAYVIHFDVDKSEHNKNVHANFPIRTDIKYALKRMSELIKEKGFEKPDLGTWMETISGWKKDYPFKYEKGEHITSQEAVEALYEVSKGEAIITTGVGQHQMWAAQYYRYKEPRTYISSLGLGTMGFGYPAAVGAKVARPDKEVIDIDGDGSFLMNVQELATAKIEKINAKCLLLNNQHLGMVVQWEDRFYESVRGHTILCDPENIGGPDNQDAIYPDYIKMCEGFGVKARRIVKREDLHDGIREMLEADEPYLLEVIVPYTEHVLPMIPQGKSAKEMLID